MRRFSSIAQTHPLSGRPYIELRRKQGSQIDKALYHSLVPRPTPQQRMDYITATWNGGSTSRSGDVIHPLLWRGSGYETILPHDRDMQAVNSLGTHIMKQGIV